MNYQHKHISGMSQTTIRVYSETLLRALFEPDPAQDQADPLYVRLILTLYQKLCSESLMQCGLDLAQKVGQDTCEIRIRCLEQTLYQRDLTQDTHNSTTCLLAIDIKPYEGTPQTRAELSIVFSMKEQRLIQATFFVLDHSELFLADVQTSPRFQKRGLCFGLIYPFLHLAHEAYSSVYPEQKSTIKFSATPIHITTLRLINPSLSTDAFWAFYADHQSGRTFQDNPLFQAMPAYLQEGMENYYSIPLGPIDPATGMISSPPTLELWSVR